MQSKSRNLTAPELPKIHTVEDFARTASLHPESVRRAIRRGSIAAIKVGAGWRIPDAEACRILRNGMSLPAGT